MEHKPAQKPTTETPKKEKKVLHFYLVLPVIAFALIGYVATSYEISHSTIQYASPKKHLFRTVLDESDTTGKKEVTFAFRVHSVLPVDTMKPPVVQRDSVFATSQKEAFHHPMLYHENPHILVWLTLISAMIAFAAGAFPIFLAQIWQVMHKFSLSWKPLAGGILYAVFLGFLLMVSNRSLPGYYKPETIIDDLHIVLQNGSILVGVVMIAVGLTMPSFVLIFLIGLSSYKAGKEQDLRVAVHRVQSLNADLQRTLKLLTVIVVFSVLTSCTLGMSIRSAVKIDGFDIYPPQIGYLYGAYFTIFLCIIYIPVYYYIKYQYNCLKEKALGPQRKKEEKENIEVLFNDKQLEGNVMDSLKIVLTLLLPLLSSFLPQGMSLFS